MFRRAKARRTHHARSFEQLLRHMFLCTGVMCVRLTIRSSTLHAVFTKRIVTNLCIPRVLRVFLMLLLSFSIPSTGTLVKDPCEFECDWDTQRWMRLLILGQTLVSFALR